MQTPERRTDNRRVLLIGNDTNELKNIQEKLSQIEGTASQFTLSIDVPEAIKILSEDDCTDILFVDYTLNGMNGLEFLAVARKEGVRIPSILITDDESSTLMTHAIEAGYDDYLLKDHMDPFHLERSVHIASERSIVSNQLDQAELRFRCVVESLSEGVLLTDLEDKVVYANSRFTHMIGRRAGDLQNRHICSTVMEQQYWESIKKRMQDKDFYVGEIQDEVFLSFENNKRFWAEIKLAPYLDALGNKEGNLLVFTDITGRKEVEDQLFHNTFHDHLTGLPNRILFLDRLGQSKVRSKKFDRLLALIIIDVDRFKLVNDSLGTSVSDKLLNEYANRLQGILREDDTIARIGTDVFAILMEDIDDIRDTTHLISKIHEVSKVPYNIKNKEIYITSGVGVALDFDPEKTAEDLMRDAETALHLAKLKGPSQYELFNKDMHERTVTLMELESDLRSVIEKNELLVAFQPIISLTEGNIVGFEALARWKHPERGWISPSEFIPVAEETSLIIPMGLWILEESCKQIRQLQEETEQNFSLSVNLSGKQLMQKDLDKKISNILTRTGFNPEMLRLEITESAIMEDAETAIMVMKKLRGLNIELYIDDFGTGYSSLSYLHRFPVNALKIDLSFISRICESDSDLEIVRTIINLAHNLKMVVIAEGIETDSQLELLRQLNCEFGQGFLISKPVEKIKVFKLLSTNPTW